MDLRQQLETLQPGSNLRTYHLVTVPSTQPPGSVTLAARIYNTHTQAPVMLAEAPKPSCIDCTVSLCHLRIQRSLHP